MSRFFMIAFNSMPSDSKDRLGSAKSSLTDEWILSKCAFAVKEVNEHFENHDFHLVTRAIRRFLYSNVCDVYLVKKTIGEIVLQFQPIIYIYY